MCALATSNCEMAQSNWAASTNTRNTDITRHVGDDAEGSRVCPLLKRWPQSTTNRDFGFPLRRATFVMSGPNTCASAGTSARGAGTKTGRLSPKVSGRFPSHASQLSRRSTVCRDMALGSGTTVGMFASWSPSSFVPKFDVGVEDAVAAASVAVGVRHVDAGTSGSNRTIGCFSRVGRGVKPGGGGGCDGAVSTRCGGGVGHWQPPGR